MILMINDRFYNETELRQLIQSQADELKDLREENKVLISECDRLIKEKGELLKKSEQIAKYKQLLKAAVEDMYNSVNDVHCKYCSKWHTDQCQETSHLNCYIENKFKWRHEAEALALIGEEI